MRNVKEEATTGLLTSIVPGVPPKTASLPSIHPCSGPLGLPTAPIVVARAPHSRITCRAVGPVPKKLPIDGVLLVDRDRMD